MSLANKISKDIMIESLCHQALANIGLNHDESLVHSTVERLLDLDLSQYSLIKNSIETLEELKR